MNGREKEEAQSDAMPELAGQYQQHHQTTYCKLDLESRPIIRLLLVPTT